MTDRTEWGKVAYAVAAAQERLVNRNEPIVAFAKISKANGDVVKIVEWGKSKPVARKPMYGFDF